MWTSPSDAELAKLLRETRSIAIVGISSNPARPSHGVYRYLAQHSQYDIYLVNPTITELDGRPVYPDLAALPVVPDLVDVFRRQEELAEVAQDAIAIGARILWFQLGLIDQAAADGAETAGLRVVMDRCTKIEYSRLIAG
jgi:predicted CoA-binding protein